MISLGFAPSFEFDRSRLKEAMCRVSAHHHDHVRTLCEVVTRSGYSKWFKMSEQKTSQEKRVEAACSKGADGLRVCPVCQGQTLIEIRGKLQCERCHTICETCCEGGRG